MIVKKGLSLYIGGRKFKSGDTIPEKLLTDSKLKSSLEKSMGSVKTAPDSFKNQDKK